MTNTDTLSLAVELFSKNAVYCFKYYTRPVCIRNRRCAQNQDEATIPVAGWLVN
jgi:hypothetical protein